MNIITHHKTVGKLKIWVNVKSASDLYTSLLDNRGIASEDLDIYEVTSAHKEIRNKENFEFEDVNTLCIKDLVPSFEEVFVNVEWNGIQEDRLSLHYDSAQLDIIAANRLEEDSSTWTELPIIELGSQVPCFEYQVCDTIAVNRLNPFT